ncbi:MAG: response regulator [Acidobacteria bacterium]|nr:response regulator [Acidobacteriota bacterium]MBV9437715.1 response regulator [Acidobacteriota bacterium]
MISCDLQAVVATSDASVLGLLPSWLRSMNIRVTVCDSATAALQMVSGQRVDALFLDANLDPEFAVLRQLRGTATGKKMIVMTLISSAVSVREAFRVSDFILDKPLVQQRVMQTLRAAQGMMVRDRMQYSRIPLQSEAMVVDADGRSLPVIATNVSQSGIALSGSEQVSVGQTVSIHFKLPQIARPLACRAKVIWADKRGKAGFSFVEIKQADREALSAWIENQFMQSFQQKQPAPFTSSYMPTPAPAVATH